MVKNIIFDLGAVLIDIDLDACIKTILAMDPSIGVSMDREKYLFINAYEKGEISEEAFFTQLRDHLSGKLTVEQLQQAWNNILKKPFPLSLQFLEEQQGQRDLYVLSNTNSAHRRGFDPLFDQDWGKGKFYTFFEKVYYSHELNMIKPSPEIYNHVLSDSQLKAEETLFIDDNADNIASASKLGIQTWLFKGVEDWDSIREMLS